jgi:hypothetical protein
MNAPRSIIWIGSFPKSGNTWVRAFLGNYFMPTGKQLSINELSSITTSDVRSEWYDMAAGKPFVGDSFDDWVVLRPKIQRLIAKSKPGNRFVKTHSKIDKIEGIDLILPEVTAAAICIIRNPFDVAISYARHSSISIDVSIERLSDPTNMGIADKGIMEILGRWDDHVQSWLKAPGLPRHVMRYEDMVDNPKVAFRGLLNFLQVPIQNKTLRNALEKTSFKALQKQESNIGFLEKPPGMEKFFVSGKAGGWVDVLTKEQVARILKEFEATIEEYFPEIAEQARAFIANS